MLAEQFAHSSILRCSVLRKHQRVLWPLFELPQAEISNQIQLDSLLQVPKHLPVGEVFLPQSTLLWREKLIHLQNDMSPKNWQKMKFTKWRNYFVMKTGDMTVFLSTLYFAKGKLWQAMFLVKDEKLNFLAERDEVGTGGPFVSPGGGGQCHVITWWTVGDARPSRWRSVLVAVWVCFIRFVNWNARFASEPVFDYPRA